MVREAIGLEQATFASPAVHLLSHIRQLRIFVVHNALMFSNSFINLAKKCNSPLFIKLAAEHLIRPISHPATYAADFPKNPPYRRGIKFSVFVEGIPEQSRRGQHILLRS